MKTKIIQKIQSVLDSMKNNTVNNEIKTKYKNKQDDVSQYVLTLEGPYGENRVNNKKNKP